VENVVITDALPIGAAWVSDTSAVCGLSRTVSPDSVVWTASQWDGGTDCWFEIMVLVGGDACQTSVVENTVVITSTAVDDDPGNNSWTTTTDSPGIACLDLAVSKEDGGLIVGPNKEYSIEYSITVSNVGFITATDVVVTDILPVEASYTGTDWICASVVCSRTVGSLLPTATVELTLPLQLDRNSLTCPIVLTNVVQVADSAGGDIDLTDNVFTLTS
jgi:hypothetical protein